MGRWTVCRNTPWWGERAAGVFPLLLNAGRCNSSAHAGEVIAFTECRTGDWSSVRRVEQVNLRSYLGVAAVSVAVGVLTLGWVPGGFAIVSVRQSAVALLAGAAAFVVLSVLPPRGKPRIADAPSPSSQDIPAATPAPSPARADVADGAEVSSSPAATSTPARPALADEVQQLRDELETSRARVARQQAVLDAQAGHVAELEARGAELAEGAIEAEQACRLQGEFLANMSHEIRTPMNAIMGMIDLALDCELEPAPREYLGLVKSAADSLLTVINDILDVSKIAAGKLDIEQTDFSLRDFLGEAMKTLATRAHEKGLELTFGVGAEVGDAVVGDPGRLRQVVFNLVGNAIKFTEKGEVSVKVDVEASDGGNSTLHFAVRDTGIGVPEEKRHKIFEAFAQADHCTTRLYGGTGLGLTISSHLVTMMGGRMWVDSVIGQGSTFHFTVKLGRSRRTPAATEPVALRGLAALVVDDNGTNRQVLGEMLRRWEMVPTLAEDGARGLNILAQADTTGSGFPLILLDCQMPDMDGFTFAERVKTDTRYHSAIIMMLTSGGQRGDAVRCRELGISAYLTKPIKQSELLQAILTVLGHSQQAAEDRPPLVTRHSLREDRRHLSILLAEDNPVNQMVARRLLEKMGHTVTVVATGQEALERVVEHDFSLVLMDVQMPEMDGLEATHAIRAREAETHQHLPIIAMTAHAMKGDRERCLAAGMDGYIAKPIRPPDLMMEIERFATRTGTPPAARPEEFEPDCIDWPTLWASCDGDRELLGEMASLFLQGLPAQVQAVHRAMQDRQAADLERLARGMKAVAANFAAMPAFQAAFSLERLAQHGDLDDAPRAWEALEREFGRLQAALQPHLHPSPEGGVAPILPPTSR